MLDPLKYRRKVAAYKKCFLDEHGQLTADAKIVFDDLYGFTRFFKNVPVDPHSLAATEGARSVMRHILKRIGTTPDELMRKTKEIILGDDHD